MKSVFSFFVIIFYSVCVFSQDIKMSTYNFGEQINDTIYTYYGSLPFTGDGSVTFGGSLTSELMPGVSFKIVIDNIDNGGSIVHTVFKDVNGVLTSLNKDDTVAMPAKLKLMAGNFGFHIIIHGIPQTVNQSYMCDLAFAYTTSNDWGLVIIAKSNKTCSVGISTGITSNKEVQFSIYPNPSLEEITISASNKRIGLPYTISDLMGKVLLSGEIKNEFSVVQLNSLSSGLYVIKIGNMESIKIIKQ
jgi:hypothetical protein